MEQQHPVNAYREPTNDDIMSATRGLGLMKLTDAELVMLVKKHSTIDLFASKVIMLAAQRLIDQRRVNPPQTYCKHCGTAINPDGKGSWIDSTDGDGCDPGVHEP